ncbi:MAG: hypothetical protein R3A10_04230 [Caldilineaceae bacterium]
MRTLLHAGVHYPQELTRQCPDVDIILIQPQADDYRMFSYNPYVLRQPPGRGRTRL